MDLGLDLVRTVGRAKSDPVALDYLRDLTPEDLATLNGARGSEAQQIVTRMKDRHHGLARCIASGYTNAEAAAVTGYSASRISILLNDPMFQDLVSLYRANTTEVWRDTHERMASLAVDAIDELHTRLEETPETMDNDLLLEIGKTFADRTGHGPSSKTTNVDIKVNFGDKLAAARERAKAVKMIEHVVEEVVDAEIIE